MSSMWMLSTMLFTTPSTVRSAFPDGFPPSFPPSRPLPLNPFSRRYLLRIAVIRRRLPVPSIPIGDICPSVLHFIRSQHAHKVKNTLRNTPRKTELCFFVRALKRNPVVVAIDSVLEDLQPISAHVIYSSGEERRGTDEDELNLKVRGIVLQRLPLYQL